MVAWWGINSLTYPGLLKLPCRFLHVFHILVKRSPRAQNERRMIQLRQSVVEFNLHATVLQEQSLGRRAEQRGSTIGRQVSDGFSVLTFPLVETSFILNIVGTLC